MPRGYSCYLDLVRFGAALIVLLSHAYAEFPSTRHFLWPGHQAVIVFFVISGFVIAYVADTKEKESAAFALARAVRILSVSLPALLLTAVVTFIFLPAATAEVEGILLNLFFLGQNWSLNAMMAANDPYWSLCYEVWYYAIFACFWFPTRTPTKMALTALACAAAGPKILLLMPCWLCGVALYRCRKAIRLPGRAPVLFFVASVAAYAAFFRFDLGIGIREAMRPAFPGFIEYIGASNQFAGDFLLALIVSANFLAVYNMQNAFTDFLARHRLIASALASVTFSIYLFHEPVLQALRRMWMPSAIVAAMVALIAAVALAQISELRRRAILKALENDRAMRTA